MGRKRSVTFPKRRLIFSLVLALLCCLLCSCEVVRTITTTSEAKSLDSTNYVIQTKVVESYVGSKQNKI